MPTSAGFQSINDQNVYQALQWIQKRLGIPFAYQYELNGGRTVRGGQVIDFVVYTPPKPTALYNQGLHWHWAGTATEDSLKRADAEAAGFRVVELLEPETATVQKAIDVIMEKVI